VHAWWIEARVIYLGGRASASDVVYCTFINTSVTVPHTHFVRIFKKLVAPRNTIIHASFIS
jgi:prophage tail gpP-like protein